MRIWSVSGPNIREYVCVQGWSSDDGYKSSLDPRKLYHNTKMTDTELQALLLDLLYLELFSVCDAIILDF